jgi:hypothetical protein
VRPARIGLLTVVLSAACGPGADSSDAAAPVELDASAVHVVGTSDQIAAVLDVDVLEDGSIWVLNSVEPFLVGFSADGELLDAYGSGGGGPEEFDMPAGFVLGAAGNATRVLDVRRHSLIEVPRPPSGRVEIPIPRDSLPPGSLQPGMGLLNPRVRSYVVGDTVVLARSFGTLRTGVYGMWSAIWGADLVGVPSSGADVRTILSLGEALGDPSEYLEQTGGFPPFPLWFRLWAVCGEDVIHVHDRMRNSIRRFRLDGSEVDPLELPPAPFDEVSPEEFVRAVFGLRAAEITGGVGGRLSPEDSIRLMRQSVGEVQGTPERLARFLPHYVDLRCGEDGALWLQPPDLALTDLRGGRHWVRLDPSGDAHDVRLPPRFDAYRFFADRVLGVQRDPLDVAAVAWVELDAASR